MFDNNVEGFNICQKMWYQFWNPSIGSFTTQTPCHESHGNQFSCYAQAVAVHAIGDSATVFKDMTLPIVDKVVKSTLKYRNPKYGAYSVDFHGGENSGNDDINYDDNAHLLRGLIQIYEATGNEKYLNLCSEIQKFMLTGITEHKHWHIKGCKWHISRSYMATISNSVGAMGAMKMIKYTNNKQDKARLYDFAKTCMDFIWEKMRDPNDNIIMDGVGLDSETIDITKYSYNQGSSLSAYCYMYQYDQNPEWKEKADLLIDGCINPGKTLYDRDYPDHNKRYLHGIVYFNQLLIEGIVDYILTFKDIAPPEVIEQCKNQLVRHASYYRKYCFDEKDGLYFMNFDIYKINSHIYKRYREEFGGDKPYNPDKRERLAAKDDGNIDRLPVVKSLIGEAAAAHMFFQIARVFPQMEPVKC